MVPRKNQEESIPLLHPLRLRPVALSASPALQALGSWRSQASLLPRRVRTDAHRGAQVGPGVSRDSRTGAVSGIDVSVRLGSRRTADWEWPDSVSAKSRRREGAVRARRAKPRVFFSDLPLPSALCPLPLLNSLGWLVVRCARIAASVRWKRRGLRSAASGARTSTSAAG